MATREYRMVARASTTAGTRARILDAVISLAGTQPLRSITLADVAAHAGVTTQTVLRHFDHRDGLFDAAAAHGRPAVLAERTPTGASPSEAVRALVDHYERLGDLVIRLLGQELDDPRARRIVEPGKTTHRAWVEACFASRLPDDPATREVATDLLVVATDVYAWKLLRRDRGLSPTETRHRMTALVQAVLDSLP